MQKRRHVFISALILCLLISLVPTAAFAGMDSESEVVATIGNVEYTDFQEALDAIQDGQTVTLIGDISGGGFTVKDKEGMKYTIDLNGYTISSEEWWSILTVESGTVTIKDGSIFNLNDGDAEMQEDGTYFVNAALWLESGAVLKNLDIKSEGRGAQALVSDTDELITMSGCKVEATAEDFDEIYRTIGFVGYRGSNVKATKCEFYSTNGERAFETSGKAILNNCKASSATFSVIAFEGANVQITKGTYKSCISIEKKAKATINDGYFKDADVPLIVYGTVTIKAGKFYGVNNAVYVDGGKVTVKKGYFSASSGKAWESKKYSKQLDKVFKISKGSKVVQSKWKLGKLGTISVKTK